jgi:hypothetical protein
MEAKKFSFMCTFTSFAFKIFLSSLCEKLIYFLKNRKNKFHTTSAFSAHILILVDYFFCMGPLGGKQGGMALS